MTAPTASETVHERGGAIVRVEGELYFLPQELLLRIVARPPIERVPGAPPEVLGICVDGGVLLPVVALGPDERGPLAVCMYAGEPLALSGLEILATGRFEIAPGDSVRFLGGDAGSTGANVPPFDLASAYARVKPSPWAGTFS